MNSREPTPIIEEEIEELIEEEELQFHQVPPQNCPLSPVIVVQEAPVAPQPTPSAPRLPTPCPTFNASWPLPNVPQGPRAFIRSSMVFQPLLRQFCPLSTATTSPAVSDGHVSDASSNSPVNTPRFPGHRRTPGPEHLYPILSPVSPSRGQPIPTVLTTQRIRFQQPPLHPQPLAGTLVDLAYNPMEQVYEARYPPQTTSPQPTTDSTHDVQLRERLAKLERENARLRNENQESFNQLQHLTEQLQTTRHARFRSMDQDFRKKLEGLSANQGTGPQTGTKTIYVE